MELPALHVHDPPLESPMMSPPPPEPFQAYEDSDLEYPAPESDDFEDVVLPGAISAESGSLRRSRGDIDWCQQSSSSEANPLSAGVECAGKLGDPTQVCNCLDRLELVYEPSMSTQSDPSEVLVGTCSHAVGVAAAPDERCMSPWIFAAKMRC
jgi:hypothetical protein